jgi:CelD/BcsL family acetyltransferase involved in cellulose biosynthesis
MRLEVEVCRAADALGPEWDPLFEAAGDVQLSRAWFRANAEAALAPGAEPAFVAMSDADGPAALIPMQQGSRPEWISLTTPYTCLFQPLLRPGGDRALSRRVGAAFGGLARRWPVTRLEALDPSWPELPAFRAGLAASGVVVGSFAHFGNWYEPVQDGWEGYLAARPGELRQTIRRKTRAVARDPALRLELVRDPAAFGPALAAYEAVYARSWKQPEPFPAFNRTLFTALGDTGALRLALMWWGEAPVAAQYWTVFRGRGSVLKLAHDEAARAVSPGTVLTAHAIQDLIEQDGVTEVDFGRGDDAYKCKWAGSRRQRIGLVAFNPLRLRGAAGLARHFGGTVFRMARSLLEGTGPVRTGEEQP